MVARMPLSVIFILPALSLRYLVQSMETHTRLILKMDSDFRDSVVRGGLITNTESLPMQYVPCLFTIHTSLEARLKKYTLHTGRTHTHPHNLHVPYFTILHVYQLRFPTA